MDLYTQRNKKKIFPLKANDEFYCESDSNLKNRNEREECKKKNNKSGNPI